MPPASKTSGARAAQWFQIALVYVLIEAALWTPQGTMNSIATLSAVFFILLFTRLASLSPQELGVSIPTSRVIVRTLAGGLILAVCVPLLSLALGNHPGAGRILPLPQACAYALWAMMQEFILQSFFFVRFESLLGSVRAVIITAFVFAAAHIPNLVLTVASFVAALFFCEMFRRYRNIFPLGVVHAALGLLMAASFPDSMLHDMRVGIGFLRFHP